MRKNTFLRSGKEGEPVLVARLAGMALTSPDASNLSKFYVDAMGYVGGWSGDVWRGALCARWLEIRHGHTSVLNHAMFAVADEAHLLALKGRLAAARVPVEEIKLPEMTGRALEFADPDGNRLIFGVAAQSAERTLDAAMVARLQHIVYASDEIMRQLDFFCNVIGFVPSDYVSDEEGNLTSIFLRCSEEHHSLAVFRASRKRLDHVCYDVDDWLQIRDWADRFAERRITLQWGPGRHGPGNNLFLFINDPDGNWLEFSAELERVEGARAVKHWVHEERTLNSWGKAHMRS